MQRLRMPALLAAAAVAAIVLFLVLRPNGGGESAAPATTASTTTTTTARPTPAPTTTTTAKPPAPSVQTVRVVVRGGKPVGGIHHARVAKGKRVALVVRADVADEIHLHGYDIARDVAPGRPARIVFTATVPGRFEVELEHRGLQIAELEVD